MKNIGTGEHHSLHWFLLFLGFVLCGESSSFRLNSMMTAESNASVRHNLFITLKSDRAFSTSLSCLSSILIFCNVICVAFFLLEGIQDCYLMYYLVVTVYNCIQLYTTDATGHGKFPLVSKLN